RLDGDVPAFRDPGAQARDRLLVRSEGLGIGGLLEALPRPADRRFDVDRPGQEIEVLSEPAGDEWESQAGRGPEPCGIGTVACKLARLFENAVAQRVGRMVQF